MKIRYIIFLVAFLITSCDILVNNDRDEPCPPTIAPGCNEVNFISIDTDAAWSPDGNTIAFFTSGSDSEDFGIYSVNSDGSDRRLFHAGLAEAPTWSPDGQWIAFHQNAHIFKKHVETDSLVQLTLEGRNFHPDWSPDGELITYDRSIADNSGPSGIWIMNTDGSNRNFSFGGFMKNQIPVSLWQRFCFWRRATFFISMAKAGKGRVWRCLCSRPSNANDKITGITAQPVKYMTTDFS